VKLRSRASSEVTGFLDKGTNITGELQFVGMVRLDGDFHGSISTSDALVVGEHAVIHADIKVGEIEIHGQIFGNIQAERKIEIFPSGRVRGDIRTPVLSMTPGASLDGQIFMTGDTSAELSTEVDAHSTQAGASQD